MWPHALTVWEIVVRALMWADSSIWCVQIIPLAALGAGPDFMNNMYAPGNVSGNEDPKDSYFNNTWSECLPAAFAGYHRVL